MKEKGLRGTRITKHTEFSLILIIIALFIIFAAFSDSFLTEYNMMNLLKQCSIIGVIAICATFVIITGGIDLSCGSVVGMSSLTAALCMTQFEFSIPMAAILAILVGGVCGLYNGFIIHEFKVPPFIATLGSMTIIRGLIKVISEAKTIAGLPEEFSDFSSSSFLGIPNLTWVWVAVIILGFFILKFTRFGRNLYVIGSGQEVARLSGINLRSNTYAVYIVAGLLCGLAGVLLTSRSNSSVPTAGEGYEMNAIAATVIGGASLSGAKGSVWGTVLSTVLMMLVDNGGIQIGIDPFIMEISSGVLITIAVVLDQFRNKKQAN